MAGPKRQHFLPSVLLSGFVNSQGQIYMLDGETKKISPRNISSVAKKSHLYTIFEKDKKNFYIEEYFSKIEGSVAPLLKKIRGSGFLDFSPEEISELINFIILVFVRTPHVTLLAEETMRDLNVQKKMRDLNQVDAEKYISKCLDQRGLSYATTLPGHFEHRHQVMTHNFDVFLLESQMTAAPFVLNDMYLSVEALSREIHYCDDGVDWRKTKLKKHFPVSNRHCVSFVPKTDPSSFGSPEIQAYRSEISAEDVSIINRLTLKQRAQYAYCSAIEPLSSGS